MDSRRKAIAVLVGIVGLWLFLGSRDFWSGLLGPVMHLPLAAVLALVASGLWLPPAGTVSKRLERIVVLFPVALVVSGALWYSSRWLAGYSAERALESFLESASEGQRAERFVVELEPKGPDAAPDFYDHASKSHQITFRDNLFGNYEFEVRLQQGESFHFDVGRANLWNRWRIYIARSGSRRAA